MSAWTKGDRSQDLSTFGRCGHPKTEANSYYRPNGTAYCRQCHREKNARAVQTPERRAQLRKNARRQSIDPDKWADRLRSSRETTRRLRETVLSKYGGHCTCCDEAELAFLQVDHVNDDGTAERRGYTGQKFYRMLRDGPLREDLQVLCANCNQAKRRDGGCPHQIDLGWSRRQGT